MDYIVLYGLSGLLLGAGMGVLLHELGLAVWTEHKKPDEPLATPPHEQLPRQPPVDE